jgi:DNA-binding transcriptional LysR family regulator
LLADEVESDLFESVPLASDSMIWVAHPRTAALAVDTKGFEAVLASQPVMTFVRDTPAYRDVRRVLSNIIGVRINPFSSITGIIAMLRSGYGIAALPARVANSYIEEGQLAEIGCGPKLAPLRLLLARPASGREPVVDAVADLVAAACIRLAAQEPG